MEKDPKIPQKNQSPKKQLNNYIKYSGLGFQMIGAIILTGWIGSVIDSKMGTTNNIWTLVFMLLGVVASIFLLIRSVTKE
ncbi:MAG TPA: AtpZ/AtpI family protein [Cytophagales bacterium]|nr:AtpZ/AtpI family protein [Cytophagales bacterium]